MHKLVVLATCGIFKPFAALSLRRVFSLRKLIECAFYNMGRIRLVWGRLWCVISNHLVAVASHPDQTVAMYAVDSMRQLVGKLLSRSELGTSRTRARR